MRVPTGSRAPRAANEPSGGSMVPAGGGPLPCEGLLVVVTSVASDSHNWNLVFLELTLAELGHQVVNLGPCVPDDVLLAECVRLRPGLVVVSTVNGHGLFDGLRLIGRIRACPELTATPVVIGGKLSIDGSPGRWSHEQLRSAGFDAVFEDGADLMAFRSFVGRLTVSKSR